MLKFSLLLYQIFRLVKHDLIFAFSIFICINFGFAWSSKSVSSSPWINIFYWLAFRLTDSFFLVLCCLLFAFRCFCLAEDALFNDDHMSSVGIFSSPCVVSIPSFLLDFFLYFTLALQVIRCQMASLFSRFRPILSVDPCFE